MSFADIAWLVIFVGSFALIMSYSGLKLASLARKKGFPPLVWFFASASFRQALPKLLDLPPANVVGIGEETRRKRVENAEAAGRRVISQSLPPFAFLLVLSAVLWLFLR